jgi:hypothetical protein
MKSTIALTFCLFPVFALSTDIAQSQCTHPTDRAQITVSDANGWSHTLWFGFHVSATYGLDVSLCEFEYPPIPPIAAFDTRFINIPGRQNWDTPTGMGQGFRYDYRCFVSAAQVDTHHIKFQPGEPLPGYPMKFKWSIAEIRAVSDSAIICDPFSGSIVRARMDLVDSVLVQDTGIMNLLLIRYGISASGVGPVSGIVPERFGLKQNYPNPFNPETIIRFDLPTAQFVSMRVYNVVGQEVATVVEKDLTAGEYALTFSAGRYGLSSGVYYYRIAAGPFAATKRMIVVR